MKFGTFHLMERPFSKGEAQVIREHLEQMQTLVFRVAEVVRNSSSPIILE